MSPTANSKTFSWNFNNKSDKNAHRAVVKRIPLTPPNVDRATKTGITHAMNPYIRSANVCDKHTTPNSNRYHYHDAVVD